MTNDLFIFLNLNSKKNLKLRQFTSQLISQLISSKIPDESSQWRNILQIFNLLPKGFQLILSGFVPLVFVVPISFFSHTTMSLDLLLSSTKFFVLPPSWVNRVCLLMAFFMDSLLLNLTWALLVELRGPCTLSNLAENYILIYLIDWLINFVCVITKKTLNCII